MNLNKLFIIITFIINNSLFHHEKNKITLIVYFLKLITQ